MPHSTALAAPAPLAFSARASLAGLTRAELVEALRRLELPDREIRMRVAQLWHWIYFRGADDFASMLNISKAMRERLDVAFSLDLPEIVEEQVSSDGTRKWLLGLSPADQNEKPAEIECVYIPQSDRGTLCVSSQVGCTLNCSFCHTGTQKLVRNLTAQEIIGQIMVARRRLGDFPGLERPTDGLVPSGEGVRAVSNIVFMGMGEPLYNLENVMSAVDAMVMATGCRCRSAASPSRPLASCRKSSGSEPNAARCWRFRCTPCATSFAMSWFRSTGNIRSRSCLKRAAATPAPPTRGASPSNM